MNPSYFPNSWYYWDQAPTAVASNRLEIVVTFWVQGLQSRNDGKVMIKVRKLTKCPPTLDD